MLDHLAILQVVVPLLAAPSCLIIERKRGAWIFACLACFASLAISISLMQQVHVSGPISYSIGGWDAPWGIEYRIDQLSAFVLLLLSMVASIVVLAAPLSLHAELDPDRHTEFYVLLLLCLSGLLGMVATADVFNVFVFLEISSLATYALVALGRHRIALLAAYRYLIVGTIGATFFLIGIGILYSLTGTLNMADLAARLPATEQPWALTAAFGFMVIGIGLKLALFPLHGWLPDAYSQAPTIATAFLAATATKASLYLFIRLHYGVFSPDLINSILPVENILLVLGISAVLLASLAAIRQSEVKRLLAFSSVAQIGYMVVGIGIGTAIGLQAALLHIFNHAVMKAALFTAVAAVIFRTGGSCLNDFRGLGRVMPWTTAGLVIGALSLIGVPLTVGFISKWYLVMAAIQSGLWIIAALVLIGSLMALFYLWKIIEVAYFQPPEKNAPVMLEAPVFLLIPLWLLVSINVYFGIDTRLTIGASSAAAEFLLGGTP